VNGTREQQVTYVQSLTGLAIFFACFVSLWFVTLLLIKCYGRDKMGCAAGYGFHDDESDDPSIVRERLEKKKQKMMRDDYDNNTLFKGDGEDVSIGAAYSPGDARSVVMDSGIPKDETPKPWHQRWFGATSQSSSTLPTSEQPKEYPIQTSSNIEYDDNGSAMFDEDNINVYLEPDAPFRPPGPDGKSVATIQSLYSIPKVSNNNNSNSNNKPSAAANYCASCCSDDPHRVQKRKFRTRLVYGLFALISLICSALLLSEMYFPFESAATTTGQVVTDTQVVIAEIDAVLQVMKETADVTKTTYETIPLDYTQLCPSFPAEQFLATFGFNPQSVISTVSEEYASYIETATTLLNEAQDLTDTVNGILGDLNVYVDKTEEYLWIVPLLIFFSMLVTFALGGLMCAVSYKERTIELKTEVPKIENWFGYTFLPLQIMVVIVSWGLVIACCFGTVVTTDTCVPTLSTGVYGTPEDTVLAVLSTYTKGMLNDDQYQRLVTYIEGCNGEDPLKEVLTLQSVLDESMGFVKQRVDSAIGIGFPAMEAQCGEGNSVALFFDGVSVVQDQFVQVSGALEDAHAALACPRLNELYTRAMHGALCTDFAKANASGFALFVVVAFSGMVLISLRAAWRTSA
jgi:hypothetical protein